MRKKNHKYIFVIGGVMSGVGKGIAASSIARILQAKGFKVNPIKVDPYLNVDAGTMNPTEHGEVFVLDSGLETDQDMGNYERFLGVDLKSEDYITSGLVYKTVIERERALGYRGKCVEALPHIPNEIIERIDRAASLSQSDITLIEIGGTVGDYQNIMFLETARRLWLKYPQDVMFILVSYLPVPHKIGEMKTKPTQTAVHQLNSYGIQPHMIIARSNAPLDAKRKEKLAIWCSVSEENVISAPDIDSIYDVPINFDRDKIGERIIEILSLKTRVKKDGLADWRRFVQQTKTLNGEVNVAVVGKYFDTGDFVLSDAYISVIEAVKYSAFKLGVRAHLHWLNAKDYQNGAAAVEDLSKFDGIIVPGGFGETGIEGKLKVIQYARENKIPYFGLCYGMQLAVVEYARNVLGLKGANTTEIDKDTPHPVIDIMPEQKKNLAEDHYGGTMRLGAYTASLTSGTIAQKAYGKIEISERHRHRYEVNPDYIEKIEAAGLVFSGKSPNGVLMEIAELPRKVHPFFMGTQFHPEFKARPLSPHPLFTEFMRAAVSRKQGPK